MELKEDFQKLLNEYINEPSLSKTIQKKIPKLWLEISENSINKKPIILNRINKLLEDFDRKEYDSNKIYDIIFDS